MLQPFLARGSSSIPLGITAAVPDARFLWRPGQRVIANCSKVCAERQRTISTRQSMVTGHLRSVISLNTLEKSLECAGAVYRAVECARRPVCSSNTDGFESQQPVDAATDPAVQLNIDCVNGVRTVDHLARHNALGPEARSVVGERSGGHAVGQDIERKTGYRRSDRAVAFSCALKGETSLS